MMERFMRQLRLFWRSVFDVRPGEGLRTLFMALHMTCVLFAYYILKPVSRALFVNKFEIDQLPYLYILIAVVGGLLAYAYTRVAVRSSLMTAVNWATAIGVACLLAIWWLLRFNFGWMLYVFNIWVSLFSIITVSQGWLVAANVFDSREAKRLYGLIGLSAVAGAAFGGTFTALLVREVEAHDLLLATAGMVLLSYGFLRALAAQKNVHFASARAAGEVEDFAFGISCSGIRRHRHLQVIMAIITITFVVDVIVEFQFLALAKATHQETTDLTAFLGNFYGIYLNLATFVMQLFLTALIVRYLGVGGTLQIMPVMIGIASGVMILVPKLAAASAMRLFEAATRYSFNRTGMELLYLPLPVDLKNRTKAFVDIFMDRFGRGRGRPRAHGIPCNLREGSQTPRPGTGFRAAPDHFDFLDSALRPRGPRVPGHHPAAPGIAAAGFRRCADCGGGSRNRGAPRENAQRRIAAPGSLRSPASGRCAGLRRWPACGDAGAACCYGVPHQGIRSGRRSVLQGLDGSCGAGDRNRESVAEQQAAVAYLVSVSPEAPIDAAWVRRAADDPGACAARAGGIRNRAARRG